MLRLASTNPAARLVLFSFLVLFIELALIRWLGSNIIYLSYFSNLILLGSFLGIGCGFLCAKSSVNLYKWSPLLLALLVLFVSCFPVHIVYKDSNGLDNLLLLGHSREKTGFPIWFTLPFIFLFVTAVMGSLAQGLAIAFSQFKPLIAYRLDILGALAGIGIFSILSYFNAPPIFWGVCTVIVFFILFFKEWSALTAITIIQITALFFIMGALTLESLAPNKMWSPYYKISLFTKTKADFHSVMVFVNNTPHQYIETAKQRMKLLPFYTYPYSHRSSRLAPDKVLIIGAGTGGDTAIALAMGAKHIDAVEIDPVIAKLGYLINPDQPYRNPKVKLTITDGRAFLQQSHELYDMIIFALPDSLTLVSGQSSLRLESYLFTEEAMQAAKQHLKPDGILGMYNFYWQGWLVDRLANTLRTTFQQSPCVEINSSFDWLTVFTISKDPNALTGCTNYWNKSFSEEMTPINDNHPFLYLKSNSIPPLYLVSLSLIFLFTIIIISATSGSLTAITAHADLFFMGVAFLLLETKSVISFSLLFGATWVVNALVFAGILAMVYLAIETVRRFTKLNFSVLYSLLIAMLALQWIIPLNQLLTLPVTTRFFVADLLLFSPVYFANLIFATQFQHEGQQSTVAFGVNMLGAMIGGLLEYLALVTGYRFLLILIGLFYTIAFLLGKNKHKASLPIKELSLDLAN